MIYIITHPKINDFKLSQNSYKKEKNMNKIYEIFISTSFLNKKRYSYIKNKKHKKMKALILSLICKFFVINCTLMHKNINHSLNK